MPLDLAPAEFTANDADDDISENPSSHHEEKSSLLSAMKQAGSSLLRRAKRVGNKRILSAMLMAGAALCAPHQGQAYTYLAGCGAIGSPCGVPGAGAPIYLSTGPLPTGYSLGLGSTGSRADPVDVATGNVFLHETDYKTPGQNPLEFTRYYNSMATLAAGATTYATTLGSSWRSTYDRYLQISPSSSPTQVIAERADGQQITFTGSGSTWTTQTDVDYRLTHSGSTWTLKDHNDTVEVYNDLGTGEGQLSSITLRNGYQQTMSYSGTLLSSVSDSYNRSLTFGYNSNGQLQTLTTPDSSTTGTISYSYISGGSAPLASVSYSTAGTSRTYAYAITALPAALTSVTDENSNTIASWTYDPASRCTSSQIGTGANANVTTFSDNSDTVITVTNALGVADSYTFTTVNGRQKISQISRASTATTVAANEYFTFDGNGYLNGKSDWNGNGTTYANDSFGDPTTIKEGMLTTVLSSPLGLSFGSYVPRTTTIGYGASSGACTTNVRLPCTITTVGMDPVAFTYITSTGETTSFTYDGNGNPASRTDTDTSTISTPYSPGGTVRTWNYSWAISGANIGLLLSITDPRSNTTSFGYPSTGSNTGVLTSITNPLSQTTTVNSYTSGGFPTKITDPNNVITTLAYDARLNLQTVAVDPYGSNYVTTYAHDPANNLSSVSLPDRTYPYYSFAFSYDSANRLTQVKNANLETVNYTLDALGDRTAVAVKNSGGTTTLSHTASFDALGRMLTSVGASSQTTAFGYDPNGNLTSITDPRGYIASPVYSTILGYDSLNRPTSLTDRLGNTTTATYDAKDAITSIKDPNGYTTTYTRDGFERVIQLISPDSGTSTYYYDLANNMTQRTDGAGVVTNRTFDAVNRELTRTFPGNAAEDVYKTYDQIGAFGYGIGHLTTMSNTTSLSTSLYTRYIAYDERGNDIGGSDVFGGGTYTFSNWKYYDAASRLTAVILPSGWAQGWYRDAAGQVTGVAVQPSPYTATPTLVAGSGGGLGSTPITHLPFGPVVSIPFANGVARTNTYDQDYRLTNLTDTGSLSVLDLTYTYDANDNPTSIADGVTPANDQTMTYDKMDRVLSAAGVYGSYAWIWDANGNRTSETLNGGTADNYSYFSNTNRLSSTSLSGFAVTYNGAGATTGVTASGASVFSSLLWNQSEQQATATPTGSAGASYKYDGFGQRLVKTASVATVFSYGKFGNLTEESNANPQTTDYVPLDPSSPREAFMPLGMIAIPAYPLSSSTALYYVHTDRLGTPQVVTDSASPPTVQWSMTYAPFGAAAAAITNRNNITQNLRFPGMYADSETGLYHNGAREYVPTTGLYFSTDPIGLRGGLSTYQYARGNPFRFTDRYGLDPSNSSGSGGKLCIPSSYGPAATGGCSATAGYPALTLNALQSNSSNSDTAVGVFDLDIDQLLAPPSLTDIAGSLNDGNGGISDTQGDPIVVRDAAFGPNGPIQANSQTVPAISKCYGNLDCMDRNTPKYNNPNNKGPTPP